MAKSVTKATLASENARLQAENAVLRATVAAKVRLPSIPLCKAIIAAPPAIQRKAYIDRVGREYPTTVEVQMWVEELREAVGLV